MEMQGAPFECLKTPFHCEDDQALALVAQNDGGVSICGDSQNPIEQPFQVSLLEQEVGPGDPQRSLPSSTIL